MMDDGPFEGSESLVCKVGLGTNVLFTFDLL
jgi:hypothetical protein